MAEHIRVFIDFWNFVITWNEKTQNKRIDWPKVPQILIDETLKITGIDDYQYNGTKVYASVDMTTKDGGKFKGWLKSFLDRQPGINIHISERKPRLKAVHCRDCDKDISNCPHCNQPLKRASEKGIDSAIITDMFSLAWESAYSIAILVTSDADYVPAVKNLQAKGFKIINARWSKIGYELCGACWASIDLENIIQALERN